MTFSWLLYAEIHMLNFDLKPLEMFNLNEILKVNMVIYFKWTKVCTSPCDTRRCHTFDQKTLFPLKIARNGVKFRISEFWSFPSRISIPKNQLQLSCETCPFYKISNPSRDQTILPFQKLQILIELSRVARSFILGQIKENHHLFVRFNEIVTKHRTICVS